MTELQGAPKIVSPCGKFYISGTVVVKFTKFAILKDEDSFHIFFRFY